MAKENDIGALWIKKGNKGEYMTGYIEVDGQRLDIVCFTNGYKKEAKHPDWRILKSVPVSRDEAQNNPLPEQEDLNPGDIPF